MFRTCPFCHQQVLERDYPAHEAQHTRRLPDGQMTDHVTVAPEQRYQGSIDKEPRWYVHSACGGVTGMPEEIIRSYLVDPFLHDERSFCTGCNRYVRTSELRWKETGESLLDYSQRLRTEHIQRNRLNPLDFDWGPNGPTRKRARSSFLPFVIAGSIALLVLLFCGGVAGAVLLVAGLNKAQPRAPQFAPRPPVAFGPPIVDPINFPRGIESDHFAQQAREAQARQEQFRQESERRAQEMQEQMQRRSEEMRQRMEQLQPPRFGP